MFAKPKIVCVPRAQFSAKSSSRNITTTRNKFSPIFRINHINGVKINKPSGRNFTIDDSAFHPDFKTIRKQYENNKSPEEVQSFIKETVESNPVVLFMKGTPQAPQCGFSSLVSAILKEEGVESLKAINVLEDQAIREGIKQFTKWPTIPQLFINKEFIGGADITKSLFESGELTQILKKAGVLKS